MATEMQKKVFDLVHSGKKKSISRAMREAGYSYHTARTPRNLTDSPSWKEMLHKHLGNDFLLKRHKYLLERKDGASVAKGLEMAYRLKKYYGEEAEGSNNVTVNIVNYADESKTQVASIADIASTSNMISIEAQEVDRLLPIGMAEADSLSDGEADNGQGVGEAD